MRTGSEIKSLLHSRAADIIEFVDISHLHASQNRGFPVAVLIGIVLSPAYLKKVSNISDYVVMMKKNKLIEEDEFHIMELRTDKLADDLAEFLSNKGYSAYSQSESNLISTGYYNLTHSITPLPHKTIAYQAGLGWIGKNNLLVSHEFGSAISMSTVLTDAPLETVNRSHIPDECGTCNICKKVCDPEALKGKSWEPHISRDERLDVNLCIRCLKCMVLCPMTQAYCSGEIKKFK